MDLPVEKMQAMNEYSTEKKWTLVCDQVGVHVTSVIVIGCDTQRVLLSQWCVMIGRVLLQCWMGWCL